MKRQLNVNNFQYGLSFGEEYSSGYQGDVIWGEMTGLSKEEDQVFPKYISCDKYYDYKYVGQVSGSGPSSGGVLVYVLRDKDYEVVTCNIVGGRWITEMEFRETYLVPIYDEETGQVIGEVEEVVYYTLPIELREGVKVFHYAKSCSGHWEEDKMLWDIQTAL